MAICGNPNCEHSPPHAWIGDVPPLYCSDCPRCQAKKIADEAAEKLRRDAGEGSDAPA